MEVSKEVLLATRGERDWEKCRAVRLRLEVGDRVLIRVVFEETFGWNGSIRREFWKETKVERATKTTITADGVSFMRESGVERGGEGRRMAVWNEYEPSTPEQIEEGRKEILERKKLRRRILDIANNVDDAVCDKSRVKSLDEIRRIGSLLDELETIIGKSEKKR